MNKLGAIACPLVRKRPLELLVMAHPHPTCQLHFPVDGRTTLAPPATRMCDGHHKMSLFAARRDETCGGGGGGGGGERRRGRKVSKDNNRCDAVMSESG